MHLVFSNDRECKPKYHSPCHTKHCFRFNKVYILAKDDYTRVDKMNPLKTIKFSTRDCPTSVLRATILVSLRDSEGLLVQLQAMLNSRSQTRFITHDKPHAIMLPSQKASITLTPRCWYHGKIRSVASHNGPQLIDVIRFVLLTFTNHNP